jgi:hypothetical protein
VATLNPSAGAMDAVGLRVAGLERLPSCRPVDCKRAGEATVRNTSVRAYSALPLARTATPQPQPISLTTARLSQRGAPGVAGTSKGAQAAAARRRRGA